jgi:hypothetical protein
VRRVKTYQLSKRAFLSREGRRWRWGGGVWSASFSSPSPPPRATGLNHANATAREQISFPKSNSSSADNRGRNTSNTVPVKSGSAKKPDFRQPFFERCA